MCLSLNLPFTDVSATQTKYAAETERWDSLYICPVGSQLLTPPGTGPRGASEGLQRG